MRHVIAYGYRPDNGAFTGIVQAWEDQLSPGEFILPAHATFTEPPAAQSGKFRKWTGSAWTYEDIPVVEPPEVVTPEPAQVIRDQRNALLFQSDWTQLPDIPVTVPKSAWATYRQELRDVPQQAGFPGSVTWPTAPTAS